MRTGFASLLVFVSGFIVMVLEIVGARYLAKDFGSSFYVWTSQIGLILIALAMGYWVGGELADRFQRISVLGLLLVPAGLFTWLIPQLGDPVLMAIISRHPVEAAIPPLWQKLDPVLGSAAVFLFPCFALATLPPFLIRWRTQTISHLGKITGMIIAANTLGSIAGVFCAGYVLIDLMPLSHIFRLMGCLMVGLGFACLVGDSWSRTKQTKEGSSSAQDHPKKGDVT